MIEIPTLFAAVLSLLARSEVDLSLDAEQGLREDGLEYQRVSLNLHHAPTGLGLTQTATGRTLERACDLAWRHLLEGIRDGNPELYALLNNAMWLAIREHAKGE